MQLPRYGVLHGVEILIPRDVLARPWASQKRWLELFGIVPSIKGAAIGYSNLLVSAQAAGPQLSNSVVAASILPTPAVYTLAANYLDFAGKVLRIRTQCAVSNVVTTPGTLTFDVRLGAVIAFNGGAMQMSTTAHTSFPVWTEILLTVRTLGSGTAATLMGQGIAISQVFAASGADSATEPTRTMIFPATAPAAGTGFSSVAAQAVDHFATFSVSTNPTNLTLHQYTLESLN